jgi:hypothetical protein
VAVSRTGNGGRRGPKAVAVGRTGNGGRQGRPARARGGGAWGRRRRRAGRQGGWRSDAGGGKGEGGSGTEGVISSFVSNFLRVINDAMGAQWKNGRAGQQVRSSVRAGMFIG